MTYTSFLRIVFMIAVAMSWTIGSARAENNRATSSAKTDWTNWRGGQGNGHSAETGLPTKWDAGSVIWKTELKGRGQSSPVISGEKIFLTTALENGRQRMVMCLDRRDGKLLWEKVCWTGEPEPSHPMNGWASPTCATDGELVFAFFGRGGLHCYKTDGTHVWSRDLGQFQGPWGTAACPLIVGDLVIQNGDSEADSFIAALDKQTGKTVWRTARKEHRGWSSPVLIEAAGRAQIVVNGHAGATAYDLKSGEEIWYCKSFSGRGTPTVVFADGLIHVVNGLSGDTYAVRPDGTGDVTKTHMAWHAPRKGGRDLPSPIIIDNYMFVCSMSGVATCYDAKTGESYEMTRLDGRFSSSPIAAAGLIYLQNEAGETYVLRPGKKIEVVAKNTLGAGEEEIFRASLSPSAGQMFSRSDRVLYCIGSAPAAGK